MDRPRFDPVTASAAGKRSGAARKRLTLADVDADMPALDTLADVKRRLDVIARWALAGLVPGSVALASVRACEVWTRAHGDELDRDALKAAEQRVAELEGELQQARGLRVAR